ncbi:RrF2 family transcriptional regulator [Oryzobacter sp. R7]|uniref:RrF2 family transcriptional regulator n=1 Tax=Oryzobacter faecalis TaxID=3388656 RepID=UPI00398CC963
MDITARTDYAVRAMLILAAAQRDERGPVSVEVLAQRQELPRKYLEAIAADLRAAGLVKSTRGSRGGYSLSRPARDIGIGDVFRAVDGPLAEVRGVRPHEVAYAGDAEHLPTVWVAVRATLREVLDGTSLEDVLTGRLPARVAEAAAAPDAWHSR